MKKQDERFNESNVTKSILFNGVTMAVFAANGVTVSRLDKGLYRCTFTVPFTKYYTMEGTSGGTTGNARETFVSYSSKTVSFNYLDVFVRRVKNDDTDRYNADVVSLRFTEI